LRIAQVLQKKKTVHHSFLGCKKTAEKALWLEGDSKSPWKLFGFLLYFWKKTWYYGENMGREGFT
jgi:hypothetical protein